MKCGFDLDNTIDANPAELQSMMSALRAAAHTVVVVTGTAEPTVTQAVWQQKADYLTSIGCGQCWDELVVASHPGGDFSDQKAQWLSENGFHLYCDSTMVNAKAANKIGIPLVLVPQGSKIKDS